jgi:ribose transport system substrate-binding protein
MLKNKQFLTADVGASPIFEGWVEADAVLRLMAHQSVPDSTIPIRLFTQDNIGSLQLTSAAENTGEWYGPTDFAAGFTKLWGVG